MVFNYFMFKVHVFYGAAPALGPYIAAYGVNYLIGLTSLSFFHYFIKSPYVAVLCSLIVVSTINYFILKRFVFKSGVSR